jgi:hypothetical protein
MKIALTSNDVAASLRLRADVREMTFFDHGHADCVIGFGLRIRATGARTWVFQYKYGDKHQRMKLGTPCPVSRSRERARKPADIASRWTVGATQQPPGAR